MTRFLEQLFDQLFRRSGFMKSVTTLLSGTLLAMLIGYGVQPILTRLYSPEAFGLFDAFISVLTLLVPFASLRYEDALMIPEKDEEALGILGLTFFLVLAVAALSFSLLFLEPVITYWFEKPQLAQFFVWIPLALITVRFTRLAEFWLNRKKSYRTISAGQVAQRSVMESSRLGLSQFTVTSSPIGLITGYVAGHVACFAWYTLRILQSQTDFWKHFLNRQSIRLSARRFRKFPRFSMPSTLLMNLTSKLPVLLLLFFFDEATVGYFGRAVALFAVPLSLIGQSISQVFFVEGAIATREGNLAQLTDKVHHRLVTLSLFPTLAIMLTAPQVMAFVLGAQWETAGVYLQWLAPWFFLASVASPLTRIFDVLERQRMDFLTSCVVFTVQTVFFIAGCLTGDLMQTLVYLSAGGFIARGIHILVMMRLAGVSLKQATTPYFQQTLISIPFLLIVYYVQSLHIGWLTTVSLVVTGLGFWLVVYRRLMAKR